jgi:biopolymer transport protein ExbD
MRLQTAPPRRPTVNVTSLIDVLFLLLTFFLVTTQFVDQSALKIELPGMSHSEETQHVKRFILNVSADGQMTLDGKRIDMASLRETLKAQASDVDASGGLILRADRQLPYGEVMGILDLVRGAGIRRIANATVEPGE